MSDRSEVQWVVVGADNAGQRLDNFLMSQLKGVPRSHVYKILRSGEVRVNKGRAKPHRKLAEHDEVRIPPISQRSAQDRSVTDGMARQLRESILFSDDALVIVNKPTGLAVHGGSGVDFGLIEAMRQVLPNEKRLELVHRLDRDTSGCLMLARSRKALVDMQEQLRAHEIGKYYLALCVGKWPKTVREVDAPLDRSKGGSGERIVRAAQSGKTAVTHFQIKQRFKEATLLSVKLESGRTHQIRVHTQLVGHALAGDGKYGQRDDNRQFSALGLKRSFLHAHKLEFRHPISDEMMTVEAPLPDELQEVLAKLTGI